MSMLTFVVDWCVYVWRVDWCVYAWRVASALDFVVFVATTQRNENMFSRARGIAVRHSSFVVAYSYYSRRCRCATRYENAGRSCPRPCRQHSSLPPTRCRCRPHATRYEYALKSSPSRDALWWVVAMCDAIPCSIRRRFYATRSG